MWHYILLLNVKYVTGSWYLIKNQSYDEIISKNENVIY